jgi:2-oxoisovalerate dehydrogenase E2 component (dihydrolipoyl transacylase)
MKEFALPDVGEGLTEAEVVNWRVAIGDEVAQDQIVVEIETAKSLVELPSPFAGTVVELLASEGDVVRVGSALVRIDSGETGTDARGTEPASDDVVGEPVLVGYGTKAGAERTKRIRKPAVLSGARVAAPSVPAPSRLLAKPPVRLLAKQRGVDLRQVPRTTESPLVTREDVLRVAGDLAPVLPNAVAPTAVPPNAVTPVGAAPRDEDVTRPIRGVLKATAEAVTRSAFTAPHASLSLTVDLTRALKVVERLRADPAWAESRPSIMVLVAKAFALAIAENPDINATWDDANQQVHVRKSINLGIAAATPRGLIVPNIKDAQSLSLAELATAVSHLVVEARAGRTAPADMSGGTVTITNIGSLGVDYGSPILNPGESAILALGATVKRPWVVGDKIKVRSVATFTLTFDHRLVNGDLGARVLTAMGRILTRPTELWRYV